MEPDLTQEQMIQDISEYELGFIDFATVVSNRIQSVSSSLWHPQAIQLQVCWWKAMWITVREKF